MSKFIFGAVLVALYLLGDYHQADAHGRLWIPPSRASLWKFPEFQHHNPPHDYDDNQAFCGGFAVQYDDNGGKCGICGDPFHEPAPRLHEGGGLFGRGIITGTYKAGQVFNVSIDLTAAHMGYFQLKVCPHNNPLVPATQECLDKYPLEVVGTGGNRFYLPENKAAMLTYEVRLPAGLTCDQCVLQWHYRTGNSWGQDEEGSGMGFGNQETFRACSDIRIE